MVKCGDYCDDAWKMEKGWEDMHMWLWIWPV